MNEIEKALVVLEQDEVDYLIHILEDRLDQFRGVESEQTDAMEHLHSKLMALKRDSGSEYRIN